MMQLQQPPKFRFYATLLDAFQWYLTSEQDEAFSEFINKVNRVPFSSEAADQGTAFNDLIDLILSGNYSGDLNEENIFHYEYKFPTGIIKEIVDNLQFAIPQVRTSGIIETRFGQVEVYGDMDYLLPAMNQVDLKTTKNYAFPKYLSNWQHIVYPFCSFLHTGQSSMFTYLVTDFKDVYTEQYFFNPERDQERLKIMCEDLAEFLTQHKDLITDKAVFGGINDSPKIKRVITPKSAHKKINDVPFL